MALQRRPITAENALMRLETLCARSEHCESELREKLRNWKVSPGDTEKILHELRQNRYYDDNRFAEAFVRDKLLYNRWGRRKIAVALIAKRIDRSIITSALDTIDTDTYTDILRALLKAKARTLSATLEGSNDISTSTDNEDGDSHNGSLGLGAMPFEIRTKLYRFALSRGFESSLIATLLR